MDGRVLEGLDGLPEQADGCATASPLDPCVVETDGLAVVVEAFVASYGTRRGCGGTEDVRLNALAALAERTRMQDPFGVGIPRQTVRNVAQRRYQTVELRTADAIVAAAGHPNAFHDGTLTVRPNPRAKRGQQATCCGSPAPSSLNGSLSMR